MVALYQNEARRASKGHRSSCRYRPIRGMLLLGAAMIFMSGTIVGGGGTIFCLRQRKVWIRPGHIPGPPQVFLLRHLRSSLDLTDQQAEQLELMLDQGMQGMHELVREHRQHMEARHQDLASKMKDILTPEQYPKWERDFSRMRRHFRSKGRRGAGRFGPRGFRSQGFPPGRSGPRDFGSRGLPPGRFGPSRMKLNPKSHPGQLVEQEPNSPHQKEMTLPLQPPFRTP